MAHFKRAILRDENIFFRHQGNSMKVILIINESEKH